MVELLWVLLPIVRAEGEADREKSVPVPVRATVCEPPIALSAMTREAALDPDVVGSKTTLMLQLDDGASDAPQLLL